MRLNYLRLLHERVLVKGVYVKEIRSFENILRRGKMCVYVVCREKLQAFYFEYLREFVCGCLPVYACVYVWQGGRYLIKEFVVIFLQFSVRILCVFVHFIGVWSLLFSETWEIETTHLIVKQLKI